MASPDPNPPRPRPLVLRASIPQLLQGPIVCVAATAALLGRVLPAVVESCRAECGEATTPWPLCFVSAFFGQCLRSQPSRSSMCAFLAFSSALLTTSHLEASRLVNQPSTVLTRPGWVWAAVNFFSGALVIPAVMCASFVRSRIAAGIPWEGLPSLRPLRLRGSTGDTTDEAQPLLTPECGTAADATAPSFSYYCRDIVSYQRTFAIPVAIVLGFVLPSIALVVNPSPLTVAVWYPFTVYTSAIRALACRILGEDGSSKPYNAERNTYAVIRIFAVPVGLSILAHVYEVASWSLGASTAWSASAELTLINFTSMFLTSCYWLLVEGSAKILLVSVLVSFLVGPGAGVSVGWVLKERNIS